MSDAAAFTELTKRVPASCFLVACCCARNEEDILDAWIAYHLAQGVDYVLVTDHGSTDGTRTILDFYAAQGRVAYVTIDEPDIRQGEWMTQMARAAAALGARWVVNADADEFWMPRTGSLQDLFRAIPADVDVVHAFHQDFLPDPTAGCFSSEQTVWDTGLGDGFYALTFKPKVAHRASPTAVVNDGNHSVGGLPRTHPLGWLPVDILHFPIRSYDQLERKVLTHQRSWKHMPSPPHIRHLFGVYDAGELPEYYSRVVDADATEAGLTAGRLVVDTRLADYLGALRGSAGMPVSPSGYGVQPAAHEPTPAVSRDVQLSERAKVIRDKQVRLSVKAVDETVRRLTDARQDGTQVAKRLRRFVQVRTRRATTSSESETTAGDAS